MFIRNDPEGVIVLDDRPMFTDSGRCCPSTIKERGVTDPCYHFSR
jgi:hypothetical protein